MMRLILPLTMMATFSETVVATPMFCSMTRIAMSLSSPRRTSISSTWDDDHRRQTLGRLVHDQEARVGDQRARDGQHLLLAAGELSAAVVFPFGEARERVIDALDRPGAGLARRGHAQVFVDGERAPEPATLRHVADAVPRDLRRRKAQHLFAAHADRAARRAREPHDGLAQGRLAHAVAPDDRQHAVIQRQIDALQRMRATIVDVEALDPKHDRRRRRGAAQPWPPPR